MIATHTLPSPSRGPGLPASSGATADPAARADGSGAEGAGLIRAAPAAFSMLLERSTAPSSANIPAPTPVHPPIPVAATAASPQPSALAANPFAADPTLPNPSGAGLTERVAARPIAFFTALVAVSAPGQGASATGNALPPTGKRLPLFGSTGRTALAMALSPTTTGGDLATAPDTAPTGDTTPAEPAQPILLTPLSLAVIDLAAAVAAPLPEPAATPVEAPPADIARRAAAPLQGIAPAASGPIGTVQPSDGAAARFIPLATGQLDRATMAAPLVRLSADVALPQSAVAIKVALPAAAAAAADTPAVPLASPWQPATPARARTLTGAAAPTDRRDVQAGELLPNAPDITSASSVAPMLAPAPVVHADPLVPAAAPRAAPADRIDFATLVDTVAQAREHAAPQTMSAPVSVSLAHADFGPVALRFRHDGDALAVTMVSADPGFAPAVSAASQADAGARAGQQQTDSQSQSSGSMTGSGNPGFAQAQTGQGQFGQGQAGQGQAGQRDQRQPGHGRPGMTARRAGSTMAEPSRSDPDIFA